LERTASTAKRITTGALGGSIEIVLAPLFGITQGVIGLGNEFEAIFSVLVAAVDVRVQLAGKLAVRPLNIIGRGTACNP
jgi:hypothetical protein